MFNFKKKQTAPLDSNHDLSRGFLKGTAKTGVMPPLRYASQPSVYAVPQVIEVLLSPESQEFLALAHGPNSTESLSEFINSLLMQERFRQGYPCHSQSQTHLKQLNSPANR